jgi:hypothetical protein
MVERKQIKNKLKIPNLGGAACRNVVTMKTWMSRYQDEPSTNQNRTGKNELIHYFGKPN